MAGVNKVILVGNLGKDPEVITFDNGDRIAKVVIATSESWKDKKTGEKVDKTEWHNLLFRGGLVNVVEQYTKKGSSIYVEGKLETKKYVDKKDGAEKYSTQINVNNMTMLGSKSSNEGGASATPAANAIASTNDYTAKAVASEAPAPSAEKVTPGSSFDTDDDLPF